MHTAPAPRGWLRPPLARDTATVAALAVVGGVFGAVVLAATGSGRHPTSTSTLFSGTVGALYLTAGVVAHLRQRDNRVGLLMVLTGIGWFAEDLQVSGDPTVHTIGLFTRSASSAFLVHLVLAFPDGLLRSRLSRAIVVAAYVAAFVFVPANVPFHRSIVENRLLVRPVPGFDTAIDVVQMVMAAAVLAILVVRWIAASRPARRVIVPVVVAGLLGGAASVVHPWFEPDQQKLPYTISTTLLHGSVLLLPLAFLLGVWRVRLGRTSVAEVLVRLPRSSPTQLRELLAWALGDPSLQIGYGDGEQPSVAAGRAVTPVERDGRRMATLVHDPALREDRHVLQAMASAVALELDNQRLAAEVRAQLDEVRASRVRIVEAGDEQRRRVERDLHDGAQQQLVTVALVLRMARQRLDEAADPKLAALLARGADGLDAALRELRELARGIHPAVLSEAGLAAAVRALAARSPASVEVEVQEGAVDALPSAVETTAYYVAAEAVTNALKHAHATTIRITLRRDGADLHVTVADDGAGGAIFAGGTGLTGLRDRVATLDGHLTLHSGPSGTVVTAILPVPS